MMLNLKKFVSPSFGYQVYGIILPVLIFVFIYIRRRDVYDLHHGILGESLQCFCME